MNYRQLQSILRQVKELGVDKLECKANAPWVVLVNEWNRLIKLGYWAVECEETREIRVSYDVFYNFDFPEYQRVQVITFPKAPCNYIIQMWELINISREVLAAHVINVQETMVGNCDEALNPAKDYGILVYCQIRYNLKLIYGAKRTKNGTGYGGIFTMWESSTTWLKEIEAYGLISPD